MVFRFGYEDKNRGFRVDVCATKKHHRWIRLGVTTTICGPRNLKIISVIHVYILRNWEMKIKFHHKRFRNYKYDITKLVTFNFFFFRKLPKLAIFGKFIRDIFRTNLFSYLYTTKFCDINKSIIRGMNLWKMSTLITLFYSLHL